MIPDALWSKKECRKGGGGGGGPTFVQIIGEARESSKPRSAGRLPGSLSISPGYEGQLCASPAPGGYPLFVWRARKGAAVFTVVQGKRPSDWMSWRRSNYVAGEKSAIADPRGLGAEREGA